MTRSDDSGFALLLDCLAGYALPPLDMYKDRCLQRRIRVRMRACGVNTFEEYAALLEHRPEEVGRLLATLTINVTQFFRNPEAWDRLAIELTRLAATRPPGFSAWSAGCASGEEAYTLAMLLATAWEATGLAAPITRVRVDATDVDEECLARARAAVYPALSFKEAPSAALNRWTVLQGDTRRLAEPVRAIVKVLRHDLGRDSAPAPPYDLVVCRNVVIYFERQAQERLFDQFADALRPGGLLFLGKVEMLYGPARTRFEPVDIRERLYRRTAA
jgi:chemotaxis methyl-accepting protein methylase